MENSKKLTPEEIDAIAETKALKHADRHYPPDSDLINTNEFGMRRVFCLYNFKDGYLAAKHEVAEKDALLKEAVELLDGCKDAFEYLDAYPSIVNNIMNFHKKQMAHGKDELQ